MTGSPENGLFSPGDLLGVILAGGGSRRFGQEKALYPLAGRAMARWAMAALEPWTARQVVLTSDPVVSGALGAPGRPDLLPDLGPLGGLHTALSWAQEEGFLGVGILACDLPLVSPALMGRILGQWHEGVEAVLPESPGPLGFEPLCGGYSVETLPTLLATVQDGDLSMEAFLARIELELLPSAVLGEREALALSFTNVNSREIAREAEAALLAMEESR